MPPPQTAPPRPSPLRALLALLWSFAVDDAAPPLAVVSTATLVPLVVAPAHAVAAARNAMDAAAAADIVAATGAAVHALLAADAAVGGRAREAVYAVAAATEGVGPDAVAAVNGAFPVVVPTTAVLSAAFAVATSAWSTEGKSGWGGGEGSLHRRRRLVPLVGNVVDELALAANGGGAPHHRRPRRGVCGATCQALPLDPPLLALMP